jgi:hypothetical protein
MWWWEVRAWWTVGAEQKTLPPSYWPTRRRARTHEQQLREDVFWHIPAIHVVHRKVPLWVGLAGRARLWRQIQASKERACRKTPKSQ